MHLFRYVSGGLLLGCLLAPLSVLAQNAESGSDGGTIVNTVNATYLKDKKGKLVLEASCQEVSCLSDGGVAAQSGLKKTSLMCDDEACRSIADAGMSVHSGLTKTSLMCDDEACRGGSDAGYAARSSLISSGRLDCDDEACRGGDGGRSVSAQTNASMVPLWGVSKQEIDEAVAKTKCDKLSPCHDAADGGTEHSILSLEQLCGLSTKQINRLFGCVATHGVLSPFRIQYAEESQNLSAACRYVLLKVAKGQAEGVLKGSKAASSDFEIVQLGSEAFSFQESSCSFEVSSTKSDFIDTLKKIQLANGKELAKEFDLSYCRFFRY